MANQSEHAVERETIELAKRLVACPSVTPADGGALDLIAARLSASGFQTARLDRGGVRNLWARRGTARPLVCLAGHVDVVPPGSLDQWSSDPFDPVVRGGYLYGRGAADMKGPLAALLTASERVVAGHPQHRGSLAVLLTSDEEGAAVDGTAAVVDALRAQGETIDACIIGEPTSTERLGDVIKNGRRGSLNGTLTVKGIQRHIAYPERGRNPIHEALPALAELIATRWDEGNEYFPPTSFQVSNLHAGIGAVNITPDTLTALFNFRFSPESSRDELESRVQAVLDRHGLDYHVEWSLSGAPFLTRRGALVEAMSTAIRSVTGLTPRLSTGGGTSDGRFIAAVAKEVVEFGPLGESIHQTNERVSVRDLGRLSTIYEQAIATLLAG